MRKWLKVQNNLESLETMLGHNNYHSFGRYSHTCKFCQARGRYVEAAYTVIYDSEMLDPPNNIQKVELCSQCSKPAIESVGISK